jgi:hypothetical protein
VSVITLPNGYVATVDDADFEALSSLPWYAHESKGRVYARRSGVRVDGKQATILLHRELMNPAPGQQVDHVNHDTLDNRRCNLRVSTNQQNKRNSLPQGGTSAFKGVSWHKRHRQWYAHIGVGGRKTRYLGHFSDEESAARAYDAAALELFGEFACLNFPEACS